MKVLISGRLIWTSQSGQKMLKDSFEREIPKKYYLRSWSWWQIFIHNDQSAHLQHTEQTQ